jgi:hypothetical protein
MPTTDAPAQGPVTTERPLMAHTLASQGLDSLLQLAIVASGAPPELQPVLAHCMQDLESLVSYAMIVSEAAPDCQLEVEKRLQRALEQAQVVAHQRGHVNRGRALSDMFGMPAQRKRVGYQVN